MQKTLLSSTENQTGYQPNEFGSHRGEDRRFGRRLETRFGWMCRYGWGSELGPSSQATAHKRAAAFQVLYSPIRWDHMSAESFVGFHGSLRKRCAYAGMRGFFLLANARSRLRR